MDLRKIKAVEERNKKKILDICPSMKDESGIYILTRYDDGFKYAYVGQAKKLLTRLAQHLSGYEQHIDLSLKAHGFYGINNQTGWQIAYVKQPEAELDKWEQHFILTYASNGYQMRNKTAGGQGKGKIAINEFKPRKGYQDGIRVGYEKARREVEIFFENYLDYVIKGNATKVKERKLKEFQKFLVG